MKKVSLFLKIVRNKYLIAFVAFVVWILFFDRNDLFTQWDRKQELNKLEKSRAYYQNEIATVKKELQSLQNNASIIEKYAREKFYLKRANEDIFIVEDNVLSKN